MTNANLTAKQQEQIKESGPWALVLQGSKRTKGKIARIADCREDEDGFWYTLDFPKLGRLSGFHESTIEIL